jgi:4-amino-4-deoxychorismate lyase
MTFHTLINDRTENGITVKDRGLAYGDGLFETFRVLQGQSWLFDRHWQRLSRSAGRLGIPLPFSRDQLQRYITKVVSGQNGIAKLILTRGEGGRGYRSPDLMSSSWVLQGMALPLAEIDHYQTGVDVRCCHLRLAEQPFLAGMKHLNRLEQVMARAEWQDEVFEGLMFSRNAHLIEATMANIFLVKDGQLLTPKLDLCGVQGVMRDAIIDSLDGLSSDCFVASTSMPLSSSKDRASKICCHVIDLTENDLIAAEAVFICNSVRGVIPVKSFRQDSGELIKQWPSVHDPLVQRLSHYFHPKLQLPCSE